MNKVLFDELINEFINNIDENKNTSISFYNNYRYFVINNKLKLDRQKDFINQLIKHFELDKIGNYLYSDSFSTILIEMLNEELNQLNQKETTINDSSKDGETKIKSTEFTIPIIAIKTEMQQTQIVYLFEQLIENKLININHNDTFWSLVSKYFIDKKGNSLDNIHQTKSQLKNAGKGKPKSNADLIEKIVNDTKNIK
jgi:hypothetical protein